MTDRAAQAAYRAGAKARVVTLANGVEVRVGDVVPMTDGSWGLVISVDTRSDELSKALPIEAITLEDRDGAWQLAEHIDLAALAAQRAGGAWLRGAKAMREAAAKACIQRAKGHRNGYNRHQIEYEREAKWCAAAIRALPLPSPLDAAKKDK